MRSLLGEFAGVAAGVFVVLLSITIVTQLIRFLGQAASGQLVSEGVWILLGFKAINYLPVILSLTLFIAVLMTLTRCYRDNEMIVWFCSGVSLTAWIRPVLLFAAPLVLTIGLLSLVLSPWAESRSQEYRRQLDMRDDVSRISPGVFQESKHDDRVYFVEHIAGGQNKIGNIFVQSSQKNGVGTMVAKSGVEEVAPNGDRFLVLVNGTRYEGKPGSADFRIVQFERYSIRIEPYEALKETPTPKSMTSLELMQAGTAQHLAELQWRLGLPVAAVVLALLAIPLSFVNPRAGRSLNLIMAILVYMIYSNILSVSNVWVAQGRITPALGMWLVHGVMAAILVMMFHRRLSVLPFTLFRK